MQPFSFWVVLCFFIALHIPQDVCLRPKSRPMPGNQLLIQGFGYFYQVYLFLSVLICSCLPSSVLVRFICSHLPSFVPGRGHCSCQLHLFLLDLICSHLPSFVPGIGHCSCQLHLFLLGLICFHLPSFVPGRGHCSCQLHLFLLGLICFHLPRLFPAEDICSCQLHLFLSRSSAVPVSYSSHRTTASLTISCSYQEKKRF
jgi:hypothetical protein